MMASALVALAIGLLAGASPWLLLVFLLIYAVTVNADSGALTSGMTAAADPAFRGATMAMHSTIGFGLSAVGAWGLGVALDAAGGPMSASGWLAAFCYWPPASRSARWRCSCRGTRSLISLRGMLPQRGMAAPHFRGCD